MLLTVLLCVKACAAGRCLSMCIDPQICGAGQGSWQFVDCLNNSLCTVDTHVHGHLCATWCSICSAHDPKFSHAPAFLCRVFVTSLFRPWWALLFICGADGVAAYCAHFWVVNQAYGSA